MKFEDIDRKFRKITALKAKIASIKAEMEGAHKAPTPLTVKAVKKAIKAKNPAQPDNGKTAAEKIKEVLAGDTVPKNTKYLSHVTGCSLGNVNTTLARLLKAGEIKRPSRGLYLSA